MRDASKPQIQYSNQSTTDIALYKKKSFHLENPAAMPLELPHFPGSRTAEYQALELLLSAYSNEGSTVVVSVESRDRIPVLEVVKKFRCRGEENRFCRARRCL